MPTLTVRHATSFLDRARGLIARSQPFALLFHTRFGIHTFGLRFPIDVLILDSHSRIVKLRRNLQPNRFFFWSPRYDTVIELPAGTISNKQLKTEQSMKLQYVKE